MITGQKIQFSKTKIFCLFADLQVLSLIDVTSMIQVVTCTYPKLPGSERGLALSYIILHDSMNGVIWFYTINMEDIYGSNHGMRHKFCGTNHGIKKNCVDQMVK